MLVYGLNNVAHPQISLCSGRALDDVINLEKLGARCSLVNDEQPTHVELGRCRERRVGLENHPLFGIIEYDSKAGQDLCANDSCKVTLSHNAASCVQKIPPAVLYRVLPTFQAENP